MNEDAAKRAAYSGQVAHAPGIDCEGSGRITLGPVHRVIGCAIDDRVGPECFQYGTQRFRLRKVSPGACQTDGVLAQNAEESLPQLAIGTEDGVFQMHTGTWYCPSRNKDTWEKSEILISKSETI